MRRNGFETFLTRTKDVNPGNVSERAIKCVNAGCDFALSVHFNGFGNKSANGTEVFVPYQETAANIEVGFKEILTKYFNERKPFARSNNINNRNETFDKKMNVSTKKFDATANKKEYFGVIRTSWEKGLSTDLVEICFLTNRKDFDIYIANKEDIAEGLAKAIVEGFGKTYKPKKVFEKPSVTSRVNQKKNRVDLKY